MGLMYDSISSGFARGKGPTINKWFLLESSQPLTFLTMDSLTTTVTLRPFSFLFFLSCFFASVDLFFTSLFLRFTCDDMLAAKLLDNLSLSLLHPFLSPSSESMRISYLFWIIVVSLSWVLLLFLTEYLFGV